MADQRHVETDPVTLPLTELVASARPWSVPAETWDQHTTRLWRDEPEWMARLTGRMLAGGRWLYGPVIVHDRYVQDGHHRIVAALGLGWHDQPIPVHILEVSA